jgi:hypothetical protein
MATNKMGREGFIPGADSSDGIEDDLYDFGGPQVVAVELSPGKFLSLREPVVSELAEIEKLSSKSSSETDTVAQTICILHDPEPGRRKITLREARKLTASQIKKLSDPISTLLGFKSTPEEEDG